MAKEPLDPFVARAGDLPLSDSRASSRLARCPRAFSRKLVVGPRVSLLPFRDVFGFAARSGGARYPERFQSFSADPSLARGEVSAPGFLLLLAFSLLRLPSRSGTRGIGTHATRASPRRRQASLYYPLGSVSLATVRRVCLSDRPVPPPLTSTSSAGGGPRHPVLFCFAARRSRSPLQSLFARAWRVVRTARGDQFLCIRERITFRLVGRLWPVLSLR